MAEAVTAGGPGVAEVMHDVAESLRLHVDDLAAELVSLIVANEEGYARGRGPVSEDDLFASCRANLERVLQMLAGTVPKGEDPLDAARRTGQRRALQFLPLGALLHSYRLCGELVWRGLVREARATHRSVSSDDLVEIATTVWSVVDRCAMACTEAYRAAEWDLQRRDETRRAAVLHALLEGEVGEGSAELLSLPPHGTFLVVVADLGDSVAPASVPERELRRRGMPSSWHTYRGMHVGLVALGHCRTEREARQAIEALVPGPAAVSPLVSGLAEVAHAYRLALLARRSMPQNESTVAWLDDRLPEALVAASPELSLRLAARLLDPLLALRPVDREPLLQTLEAWIAHGGSPGQVATSLFCHRNTVLKRVHRIESLTGTSLSDVYDLTAWTLALFAHRLFPAQPPVG